MATGKKSFVLYADLYNSVEHLTDEEMGQLFKHILLYVNDKSPVLKDRLLLTAWKPIERSLKDDLKKWEEIRGKRAKAGAKGGKKRAANQASATFAKQTQANQAVSDTVSDTVSEIKRKKGDIPAWDEFKEYSFNKLKELDKPRVGLYEFDLKVTFESWLDNGWKDGKGNEIKSWKQKISNYLRNDWIKPQKPKKISF